MTTLPPYPSPSDFEREALAEEARQAALPDSPQARRNKRLLVSECAGDVRMILAKGNDELRHEVVILRVQLLDCQITIVAQAEVIKAQRMNLDTARNAMREVMNPYCQCWACKVLRAALEGVEPEDQPIAE